MLKRLQDVFGSFPEHDVSLAGGRLTQGVIYDSPGLL